MKDKSLSIASEAQGRPAFGRGRERDEARLARRNDAWRRLDFV
jgi:hypothetical protein